MQGTIFDIKEFTVHDGPGSRITVFLKGCPLRCVWCHNPEGLKVEKQLMYKSTFCTHCNNCFKPCSHEECQPFQRCIHACMTGCLTIAGETIDSDELAKRLKKNEIILKALKGGVTFSGGEPMMQADFVCDTAERLGDMHKAIQTSGFADLNTYQRVIAHFDYVMQDIKLISNNLHRKYTGVSNDVILKNAEWLKSSGKNFVYRVPLIPGITDTEDNLRAISEFVGNHKTELMPYNEFAGAKYKMVGMKYTLGNEKNRKEDYASYFKNAVLLA